MTAKIWGVITLTIALTLCSSGGSDAQLQKANTNATHDRAQLMDCVAYLEACVEELEFQLSMMLTMTAKPDKDYVLRDITGRAVGYWGIDGVYIP